MTVTEAHDRATWNSFLAAQTFRPFLQSWEMGEIYRDIGQKPVRLEVREGNELVGICFGHVVPARRGKHLSIPYGPIISGERRAASCEKIWNALIQTLRDVATDQHCTFIRLSPFLPIARSPKPEARSLLVPAPLHLLAEHIWYLPLVDPDPWLPRCHGEPVEPSPRQGAVSILRRAQDDTEPPSKRAPDDIFKTMRATTRNLIRRAEKEGVTITASDDPLRDLPIFLKLHDETRKRHKFTPYTDAFFHAQIKHFSSPNTYHLTPNTSPRCSLYLAHYRDEVIASSIHVNFAGETSYHHGASTEKYRNIPASYLLQWHAIQDAIRRGDHIYNFWGIAPSHRDEKPSLGRQGNFLQEKQPHGLPDIPLSPCKKNPCLPAKHPFAGVTLFKTGFGGNALELTHCMDLPLKPSYYLTRGFEMFRKWRRGF